MGNRREIDLDAVPGSPYARERRVRFGRLRFAPAVEREFAQEHLYHARGRIRAWHSTVLAVLLFSILPLLLALRAGDATGPLADAWSRADTNMLLFMIVLNTASRSMLVLIAWTPWFERFYPRVAFPLVAVCHGTWTFACSGEILAAHPEYLAPLVTDTFAAYFFSGLLFRQAIVVNLVGAGGLLIGGWYYAGNIVAMLPFGSHFVVNIVMSAIAGFAHERAARSQFLEQSLLGEMAARDGLTGLKNRRAFDEHLARVWQQALRDSKTLAILMVDVDGFKHYNDCYGHQAGDQVLKRIAAIVNRLGKRPFDIAARYGGEELAVILYDATREQAEELAERLHGAVRALAIDHPGSVSGIVSVSIGVAIVRPRPRRSPQGALQLADQALYAAKREGRDRITVLEHEYDSLSTGVFQTIASVR
ncbi:MAG TPA: GGDEF domain-containing protein [Gammaproteobacteria bacterium]